MITAIIKKNLITIIIIIVIIIKNNIVITLFYNEVYFHLKAKSITNVNK